MRKTIHRAALSALLGVLATVSLANAVELKVLTAGAFAEVLTALLPDFERQTGHKVTIDKGTAGGLAQRIENGEAFDIAVITPRVLDALATDGKVESQIKVASVGIGVGVKAGAPKPDISTVDAFKRALQQARAVAYIDPASGGSSGIYFDKLLERLGIAGEVRPKAKLKQGGHAADFVASDEADLVVQQISEILPVKGVALVGPLPPQIQNTTIYSAALSTQSKQRDAARALLKVLSGPQAAELLKANGMQPAT